jgi:hypothetical protein
MQTCLRRCRADPAVAGPRRAVSGVRRAVSGVRRAASGVRRAVSGVRRVVSGVSPTSSIPIHGADSRPLARDL